MDGLTFLAKSEWPVATVVLLIFYRLPIAEILKRLKIKGLKLPFVDAELTEVGEELKAVVPLEPVAPAVGQVEATVPFHLQASAEVRDPAHDDEPPDDDEPPTSAEEVRQAFARTPLEAAALKARELIADAGRDPELVILESWSALNSAIVGAVSRKTKYFPKGLPSLINLKNSDGATKLFKILGLTYEEGEIILALANVRRKIATGAAITVQDGLQFRDLTNGILPRLHSITAEETKRP